MAFATEEMNLLSRLLDVASLRQDVIAQNVANVNTPGYGAQEVNFEDALQHMFAQRDAVFSMPTPEVVASAEGTRREDGNNVNIDLEMARLQKNALYFKIYTQILAGDIAQYRSAIVGH